MPFEPSNNGPVERAAKERAFQKRRGEFARSNSLGPVAPVVPVAGGVEGPVRRPGFPGEPAPRRPRPGYPGEPGPRGQLGGLTQ